jgi:two-component system, OmpR family, sensor histidine kinase KdpD
MLDRPFAEAWRSAAEAAPVPDGDAGAAPTAQGSRADTFLRRGPLEAAALVLLVMAFTFLFGAALGPANPVLLCIVAVAVAGMRHGLGMALAVSFATIAVIGFSQSAGESPQDWVTLACFSAAAFFTAHLAGRFRGQLDETRTIAQHNEQLYEASRLLAGSFREEELIRVVREAAGAIAGGDTLLLRPQTRGELEPAHAWDEVVSVADRAAAEWSYQRRRPGHQRSRTGWYFLPLTGERGALGVLGVHRQPDSPLLGAEQQRLLLALCHSAGVALERCRLSEEMRSAQMLAEAEQLRAALLSSVSHDLRTPLASIIGATSTLSEFGDAVPPPQQRELLTLVLREAERLDRFVANLLDMTRIEYGKLQPRPSWCDVRDIIAGVVRSLHLQVTSQPLEVVIDAGFPLLHVDGVLLERVLENLVDNAVKHAGADPPVCITARVSGAEAVLQVIDHGPGLSPEDRSAVLAMVHRARDRDARSAGAGLGLAICRGFVAAVGGTLELRDACEADRDGEETPARRGLCAEIRLPLRWVEGGVEEAA